MKQKILQTAGKNNEQGLVSIITVTLIIIILALMTAGFAKVMDRELRQSLDQELAVQANYAAESGLNDARNYVTNAATPDTGGTCLDTNNLNTPDKVKYFAPKGEISNGADNLVKYTCVNIDTTPKELKYDIPAGTSRILKVASSDMIDSLYFSWNNIGATGDTGSKAISSTVGTYPPESFWNTSGNEQATGVLRTTIYPVPGDGSVAVAGDQNSKLESLAKTYFMYPNPGSRFGQVNFITSNGTSVEGKCDNANYQTSPLPYAASKHFCNSKVTGLGGTAGIPAGPPGPPGQGVTNGAYTAANWQPPDISIGRDHCLVFVEPSDPNWTNGATPPANDNAFCYDSPYTLVWVYNGVKPAGAQCASFNNPNEPAAHGWADNYICAPAAARNNLGLQVLFNRPIANIPGKQCRSINEIPFNAAEPGNPWIGSQAQLCYNTTTPGPPGPGPIPATPPAGAFYYVKLTALYRDLTVSITGTTSTNVPVSFIKAQAIIDVTAKGNDVLKRVQSTVDKDQNYNYPSFAVQSMDSLCKRLRLPVGPNGATDYQSAQIDDGGGALSVNNIDGACKP